MHQHNLLTEGKSYAGSGFFGGKEWGKDLFLDVGRHADAVILNLDLYTAVALDTGEADIRFRLIFEGFNGVQQQVD